MYLMVVVGGLLLLEPDFGALVVILCIATGILFLGGINARVFGVLVVVLTVSFVVMMLVPQSLAYGPAKAALINLAETLYLDLQPKGLGVYVINPGFVKTPLTDQNEFKMPHLITAEAAAQHIGRWLGGKAQYLKA